VRRAQDFIEAHLGEPLLQLVDILTLDRRGFTVYRTQDRKSFSLLLDGGAARPFELPVFSMGRPRVNLADRDALEQAMES
jgi:hypothetical protein